MVIGIVTVSEMGRARTDCVILDPTGRDDLERIRENLGYRLGAKNISLHIRVALRAMANMTPDEARGALDRYLRELGAEAVSEAS